MVSTFKKGKIAYYFNMYITMQNETKENISVDDAPTGKNNNYWYQI